MAQNWLQIRVDLVGGNDVECDPRPGRVFLVGPRQTFEMFAGAIDQSFGRGLGHLHEFELMDGRRIGLPDEEDSDLVDAATVLVAAELSAGEGFVYTFDLGAEWRHLCIVLPGTIDPTAELGEVPPVPITVDGWGSLPDQYGRDTYELD